MYCFSGFVLSQSGNDGPASSALPAEDLSIYRVTRLPINSAQSDFSPYVSKKHLFFVSGRNKDLAVDYVDKNGESEITDLYSSAMTGKGQYRKAEALPPPVNSKFYEGPFCIDSSGNNIYMTGNDNSRGLLRIFHSRRDSSGRWSDPRLLPFCNDSFSYCHPALSPGGDFMVFACDRNKAMKGMDLFRSDYRDGTWSEPVALGPSINDSSSQVFPFIDHIGRIYFSSDKKSGYGGLDIYSAFLHPDSQVVSLMPTPFNSPADDFGIWLDSAGTSGYFSSNRVKNKKDDIFHFERDAPDFSIAPYIYPKNGYCFSFVEESTLTDNDTLHFTYEWDFGDGNKARGAKARYCFSAPGEYNVQLNVVQKVSGEIFMSQISYPLVVERHDHLAIRCADTLQNGIPMDLSSENAYIKDHEVLKTYWDFGDGRYNSGESVKHAYLAPGTYTLVMGVVAKERSTGNAARFRTEKKVLVINTNNK